MEDPQLEQLAMAGVGHAYYDQTFVVASCLLLGTGLLGFLAALVFSRRLPFPPISSEFLSNTLRIVSKILYVFRPGLVTYSVTYATTAFTAVPDKRLVTSVLHRSKYVNKGVNVFICASPFS